MAMNKAVADLTQIQAMARITNAAQAAYNAWVLTCKHKSMPDQSNWYEATQASTEFTHAMLRLGNALEGK